MRKWRFVRWKLLRVVAWSFVVAVLPHGCNRAGTNLAEYSESRRQKVFALHAINPDQAKVFLDDLGLGTVSSWADRNSVLVTATPAELRKAGVVLDLVDNKEEFVVKAIAPAAALGLIEAEDDDSAAGSLSFSVAVGTLPGNDQIARALGHITIGTFANPPGLNGDARAIIDIHGESVVAIVPEDRLEELLQVVELGIKPIEQKEKALPPPDPTDRHPYERSFFEPVLEIVKNHPGVQPEDTQRTLRSLSRPTHTLGLPSQTD